jgi:hypothetical protein
MTNAAEGAATEFTIQAFSTGRSGKNGQQPRKNDGI